MNRLKYFLLLAFFVGCGALIGAPSAQAASEFDNALQIRQGPLTVRNNADQSWETPFDFGVWLHNTPSSTSFCTDSTIRDLIIDGISNNYDYAVVQQFYQGNGALVYVYVDTDNSGTTIEWATDAVYITGVDHFMLIYQKSPYDFNCGLASSASISNFYPTSSNNAQQLWTTNANMNYPPGYDGETVPIYAEDLDYWVNFTFTNTHDTLQAKYTNYKTDPEPSYLPQPKSIWWILYQDDTNVTTGTNVCEIDLRIDIPFNTSEHCKTLQIDQTKKYFLTAQVNPTTSLNEDVFLPITNYDITFKRSIFMVDFTKSTVGSTEFCEPGAMSNVDALLCANTKQLDIASCFTIEFPFVNLDTCLTNFEIIFSYITYQTPRFPEWQHESQCRSLNVMDDWLGLPQGYTVCPQIPDYVRVITTPFVAFLLGLVTIGFINRHNKDI